MAKVVRNRAYVSMNVMAPAKGDRNFAEFYIRTYVKLTQDLPKRYAYEHREIMYQKLLAGKTYNGRKRLRRSMWPSNPIAGMAAWIPRAPFLFDSTAKLKPATVERKAREGADPRPLLRTGEYMKNIIVRKNREKGKNAWMITFKVLKHPPRNTLPMRVLARLHEYGSHKFKRKPRPHWRPANKIAKKSFLKAMSKARIQALTQVLKGASRT
jgi:hypothetical protein